MELLGSVEIIKDGAVMKKEDVAGTDDLNFGSGAEITVGMEEKLSGPRGSYSSVSLSCVVKLQSDPGTKSLLRAKKAALTEVRKFLNTNIEDARKMLDIHIERITGGEEDD